MAGVDAARGFNYQHCHEVLSALAVLADSSVAGIRVEGDDDVIDIEVHAFGKADGETRVVRGIQVKARMRPYVWAKGDLIRVFRRWAALPLSATAEFTFQTDGELGPSGREFARALEDAARGEYGPIAGLLDVDSSDPLCAVAGQARVVAEPGSVEALLLSAEREVKSMLDGGPDHPDAAADARARVDQLWRLVSTRAGHLDPAERFIPRDAQLRPALAGVSSRYIAGG